MTLFDDDLVVATCSRNHRTYMSDRLIRQMYVEPVCPLLQGDTICGAVIWKMEHVTDTPAEKESDDE